MDAANNGMNEVMIMSPILEEYLREKYPSYKYNSSTCKEIKNARDLQEELNRDYQYVVLDYNLNGHWELLDGLEKVEKLEVLVNTLCVPNCKRRGEHYRQIAKAQKIMQQNRKTPPEHRVKIEPWYCEYGEKNCLYTIQDYPTFISVDAIWNEYLPRGINNFKIEGRTANLFSLIETYCYYMIKPECVGPARLLLLKNLENMKVVTVNKPRPSKWP
jgi:collagenase-like PrtC family protease